MFGTNTLFGLAGFAPGAGFMLGTSASIDCGFVGTGSIQRTLLRGGVSGGGRK